MTAGGIRVLLVNPSYGTRVSTEGRVHHRAWPPLDLLNCAAILREGGHDVRLVDARARPTKLQALVDQAHAANLTILTTTPLDRWQCPPLSIEPLLPLCRALPSDKLVVAGAHATVAPDAVLKLTRASGAFRGEPEALAQWLARRKPLREAPGLVGRAETDRTDETRAPPLDLASLPLPAYDLVPLRPYQHELFGSRMAMLETSRGCPRSCLFCFQAAYNGPVRWKSAAAVEHEVRWAVRCGAGRIMFIDLDFLSSRARSREILARLAREPVPWCCDARADSLDQRTVEEMRRAGCRLVHLGAEFGDQARLDAVDKDLTLEHVEQATRNLRKAGIESACLFMVGCPGETEDDFRATLTQALRIAPDYVSFVPAVDYRAGFSDRASFDLYQPDRWDEIHRFCSTAMRRFYLRPRYLLRRAMRWRQAQLMLGQLLLFAGHTFHTSDPR